MKNRHRVEDLAVGDIVELSGAMSGKVKGIVIERKEVKAKNIVGRGGFVEIANILLSNGSVHMASGYTTDLKVIIRKKGMAK